MNSCHNSYEILSRQIQNQPLLKMSAKSINQHLYPFCTSPNYNQLIKTNSKFSYTNFNEIKYQYQPLSNPIQVLPPSVWFTIQQGTCLASIHNDIQKSRKSKQGYLLTSGKGNLLNRIIPYSSEEDIGMIQDSQNCLCVSYSIIKDNSETFVKCIGSQLRSCLLKRDNIFESQNVSSGNLDEITKQIYRKFRVFITFDVKSQPGKILVNHSCFYPNMRFITEKIKTKDNIKYAPNEVFRQIKEGRLNNSFGYLSLDTKKRFLMIKKDDPEFSKQFFTGIWITGSFPLKRSRKQFGKQDAIWQALFDFYTNPEVIKKTSVMAENKGIICYFSTTKQNFKPELYLFSLDNKFPIKWSFLTKSECFSDMSRPYEIKFDFVNTTIIEEREYSEFSDQTNNEEIKFRNQNINRENTTELPMNPEKTKLTKSKEIYSGKPEVDLKDVELFKVKQQLQFYKKRCTDLQLANKMLLQQRYNQMMYQQPYMNQINLPQGYSYNMQYPQQQQQIPHNSLYQSHTSISSPVYPPPQKQFPSSPEKSLRSERQEPKYVFPEENKQVITFAQNKEEQIDPETKPFIKKKSQQDEGIFKKQNETLRTNSGVIKQIFVKQDAKNISFQDSFMEHHSDNQEGSDQEDTNENQIQYEASNSDFDEKKQSMRSPEFKKYRSEKEENHYKQQQQTDYIRSSSYKHSAINNRQGLKEKQITKDLKHNLQGQPKTKKFADNLSTKYGLKHSSDESSQQKPIKKDVKSIRRFKHDQNSSDDSDEDTGIKQIMSKYR